MTYSGQFRLVPLRDELPPSSRPTGDTPERIAEYYRQFIENAATMTAAAENMVVIFVNTRRRITGWLQCASGTMDTLLVAPAQIFRAAILHGAKSIVLTHNHPSGDPTPSEADIRVTRDLKRAGDLIKIEVLDHLIIGHPQEGKGFLSLRELGYFYQ